MSEVILVRPGHTAFDEQQRIQGLLDLPLSDRGRQHLDALIEQLRPLDIDVILTDPGEPALTTAQAIGDALDVSVKERPELRNLDQGLWQGLQLDEIRRKYPKLLKQWQEHPETICPPQGEPVCDAIERIAALKKPLRKYKRVVIVAADPLAALISGLIRDAKPEFTGPVCSHAGRCVEFVGDGEPAAAVNGNGASATNGAAATNGNAAANGVHVNGINGANGQPVVAHAAVTGSNGHEFGL